MTSLLAAQLNRLRLPEGQAANADQRRRKSLVHSPLELNKIDAAAHLERAQKAFRHLVNVDPSLEEFQDCFFSDERINFEPSMQTPDQKAALDQFIEHFYIRVSQHLLLGVTLEALEWLVYRFQTHLYNMDFMLQAIFPYHSTNLFPKFLQLFDFTAQNKRWHWLKPLANKGLALTRVELVRMAARDESLLNFLCQLVQRAFKVFGPEEARLQLFVNLFAQVTLGVLMKPLDDTRLTKCVNSLNFYVLKGMRSPVACYRYAAYQIVQLLSVKHQLSGGVLHIWIKRLLKSSSKHDPAEVCLLIAALCKTQKFQVPDDLTEKFLAVCGQCDSRILDDFPEIVSRSTAAVDIMFDRDGLATASTAAADVSMATVDGSKVANGIVDTDGVGGEENGETADVTNDAAAKVSNDATHAAKNNGSAAKEPASANGGKGSSGKRKHKRRRKRTSRFMITESAVMRLLLSASTSSASSSLTDAASDAVAASASSDAASSADSSATPTTAGKSDKTQASASASPLTVAGSLVRLLASPAQSIRCKAIQSLRLLLAKARPSGDLGDKAGSVGGGPSDESEDDALIWDTVETVLADARAIEHDQHWVMRQQLAPACCRLVWMSMAELVDGIGGGDQGQPRRAQPLTPPERFCLLGHLAFLTESQLVKFTADSAESTVRLLLRMIHLPDPCVAKSVAMKVTPSVFNQLSVPLKQSYLLDGLGSTALSEDPEVVAQASACDIDSAVFLDSLANMFGLVPTRASIQNLSAKRKSISPGNVYTDMSEQCRRQTRLLFKLMSGDCSEKLDNGLQLVIRLLEVLKILVHANSCEQPMSSDTAVNADAESVQTTSGLVYDIGFCLLSADRAAVRTPDGADKISGLSDLIPVQAVLECARSVSDRRCQYAAVGLLCRLCRLAPASAAACCRDLIEFLTRGGFFGRSDRHSGELWQGLAASVLPAYVRCNPSGIPLLVLLLDAYDDMSPGRRCEVFAQLVSALGVRAHLWALALLLNRRARAARPRPRRRRRPSESVVVAGGGDSTKEDEAAAAAKPPPTRRRRLSGSLSVPAGPEEAPAAPSSSANGQQQQPQQHVFDNLCSSVMSAFPVPQQLLACAALLRHLLKRLDADYARAAVRAPVSFADMMEEESSNTEDLELGDEEVDEDDADLLLPAGTQPGELASHLEAALGLIGAHLVRQDLLAGMSEEASLSAMTRLLGVLVDVLLWSTSPPPSSQQHQQHRQLTGLCVRTIERAESAVPGAYFLRVVNGLLARPEAPVRRKALDLMLSKLTALDGSCVASLGLSLLDCLTEVEKNCASSQVALICGRELVRLLGQSEPQPVLKFCMAAAAASSLLLPSNADPVAASCGPPASWESFGCALLVCTEAVKQLGIGALPLVAKVMPHLLPRLQPPQLSASRPVGPPPLVVLLAGYAFLQQCTGVMCDLMVPYLPQLLPITIEYMLTGDAQLRPKLRPVLVSVARGVPPSQLLPVIQGCLKPRDQLLQEGVNRPWLRADQWARLLRLNLQSAAADAADTDAEDLVSLADFEAELSDIASHLLDSLASDAAADAELACENGPEDRTQGLVVSQLAACLLPLPPASRAILLQGLQDWVGGDSGRDAALHRLLAAALAADPAVPGLAALLCELDAPQRATALLDEAAAAPPPDTAGGRRRRRRLLRWVLACLSALFRANCLSLELLDSLGALLVDRLVSAPDAGAVTDHLLPCLTAYAEAAAGDEALLRPLLRRLCDRGCRCQESADVRHWSLLAVQSLLDALGEVFIDSLAADCVPAVAELAEDDSEEVERLAQRLLAEIERRAGEPLEL